MPEIENYNCEGMCSHAYCDKKYTYFHKVKIKWMELFIPFCEKHHEEFYEEGLFLRDLLNTTKLVRTSNALS